MVEKGFFADDPAATLTQKLQHLIFLIDQIKPAAMHASLSRVQIRRQVAKFQHIFAMSIAIAHQRVKSGDQFLECRGLVR